MAVQTYFIRPDVQANPTSSGGPPPNGFEGSLALADPGAEATSSPNTGWTVAKIAPTTYSPMSTAGKQASSTFLATVEPQSPPLGTDCCATNAALNGTFAAGVWTVSEKVIAVTSGGDQDGNLRFRLWKSSNGSVFTELTAGAVDCATVTNLATTASQVTNASTASIGPFTLTNEWLYLQLAWKISGAGGANTRDVVFRVGTGITLVTPNFTAAAATPFYSQQGSLRNDRDSIQNIGQAVKRGAYFCLGEKWARRRSGLIVPSADRSFAFA